MSTQTPANYQVQTPSLPKGGGAIHSVGNSWGAVGMTGAASLQIPLPLSPGRGFTPAIDLNYHSPLGNGPFGTGWTASAGAILRSTLRGVPAWDHEDSFIGPSGVELVPERTASGALESRSVNQFNGLALGADYSVVRYLPRTETNFDRIEHWSSTADPAGFWLVQGADGNVHLFGKTASARIADPQAPTHVAQWLLEESLNPFGEQILYRYKADTRGDGPHDYSAQRYLSRIGYGNITPRAQLALWTDRAPAAGQWHFELLLDYGERTTVPDQTPGYAEQQPWPVRSDPFSSYAYGFELGTRRLCRQILMFHYFPEEASLGPAPVLTRRLLLEYATTGTGASLLQAVHQQAVEAAGAINHWPPLELTYSGFELAPDRARYQPFDALHGPHDGQGYQLVDLYSDGLPGVLYRSDKAWHYREPLRGAPAVTAEHVAYGPLQTLARIPVADRNRPLRQALTDLNGDGRLEWVVAQPGMSGFFTLEQDRQWAPFTPFAALPQEFFQPMGQLAELMGSGLQDLVLIGSNSVRLYPNQGQQGFAAATHIPHAHDDDRLPLPGDQASEVLAFSDLLGSGQQHLVRIRHNEIKCWPNLGRGRFGKGFVFASLPFSYTGFEASRVLLADLDGSGASDLIYLEADQALIFMNQCGNGLQTAPTPLPWPTGVRYDRLCQVSVADLQGLGCTSLVLSVTHPVPQHWRYDFVTQKPYLLTGTDNNMGAVARLRYRSSAQQWLDEKQLRRASRLPHRSGLAFALHLVNEQQQLDQISGNQQTQRFEYRDGFYDGKKRRFQGYGLVLATDTEHSTTAPGDQAHTAALLRKTWYHTGKSLDMPRDDYWAGDAHALLPGHTLLTRLEANATQDSVLPALPVAQQDEARHALSGLVLREEVFAADDPPASRVPYTVSQHRYQLRLLQPAASMLVLPLELQVYRYEREPADPACQHTINLRRDRYGCLVHGLTIDYARRKQASDTAPFSEPHQQTWWRDTHDPAQQAYYISEVRAQFIHLDNAQRWRLQLPYRQRSNALVLAKAALDPKRISYEHLIGNTADNPLGPQAARTLAGLSLQHYCLPHSDTSLPPGQASFQALAAHRETAELDEQALSAYDEVPTMPAESPFDLAATLAQEHYHPMRLFLPDTPDGTAAPPLWSLKQGFARYAGEQLFYRPQQVRPSESHAATTLEHDRYSCHLAVVTGADGCSTQAVYDYRLQLPIAITDAQGSVQQARYDAFGQLQASSLFGQEQGKAAGFAPLASYRRPADDSPRAAIDNPRGALLDAASACFYAPFNWMGHIPPSPLREQWIAQGYLTPGGHIRASTRSRLAALDMAQPTNRQLAEQILEARREPVCSAVLQADQYPTEDVGVTRQIRINLTFSDGFGRELQTKQKTSPGQAYVVTSSGRLGLDSEGKPLRQDSEQRWRVSGRVEYNNKGLVVRNYRAYFADHYRYIDDETLRKDGYSDQTFHDPLGRPVRRLNGKGHVSRQTYCTWYTISEDENDTWEEDDS